MNIFVLDAETYWDREYSLSKLPIDFYVPDPRFHLHGWGVLDVNKQFAPLWLNHHEFVKWAKTIDWSSTWIVGHNVWFDGFILARRYGIRPKMWVDTMSMARGLFPWWPSHSLDAVSKNLPTTKKKGNYVVQTFGVRHLDSSQWGQLGEYCVDDCEITAEAFEKMRSPFPRIEYLVVDITVRMFTEPMLEIERSGLADYLTKYREKIRLLLESTGVDRTDLRSNDKFAALLRRYGVEPPVKISPKTKKVAWAFAKTDVGMQALRYDNNDVVRTLAEARLGVKSSIVETRSERLLDAGALGPLAIELRYWGAKVSGRHSGGGGANFQNIPGRTTGKEIRWYIIAPKGYVVVVGDSANIELRLAMKVSGHEDVLDKLRVGTDLYCDFAGNIYGRTITDADETERFVGKTAMLSLQYGAGDVKFGQMLANSDVVVDPAVPAKTVSAYRYLHSKIPKLWKYLNDFVLPSIAAGRIVPLDVNGWVLTHSNSGYSLPGNLGVYYHDLRYSAIAGEWSYLLGKSRRKIYGGKVMENLCQHLARHVVMFQKVLIARRYHVVNQVHDEIVCVVREDEADDCVRYMHECLSTAPRWCVDTPLKGKVGVGRSYGEAKSKA